MKKLDMISYLKIYLGVLMVFPLAVASLTYEHDLMTSVLIAMSFYVALIIPTILMFNYLEYGQLRIVIKEPIEPEVIKKCIGKCNQEGLTKYELNLKITQLNNSIYKAICNGGLYHNRKERVRLLEQYKNNCNCEL